MADPDGGQSLPEWRHPYRRDDRETQEGAWRVRWAEQGYVAWGSLLPSASLSSLSLSLPCPYGVSPVVITCEMGTWERPTSHAKSTGCV